MGMFDSVGDFLSSTVGMTLGGAATGKIFDTLTGSGDTVDTSALQADAATAQATANTNLTAYYNALGIDPTTGETVKDVTALTDAQKAQVAADKAAATGSTNQFLASAGLSDSSMGASARAGVESAATIEAGQLEQQNLKNALAQAAVYSNTALTAMGISSQDLQAIYGYQYAEKQAQTQALSGLMSTAAMAAVMMA